MIRIGELSLIFCRIRKEKKINPLENKAGNQ
jgi:hypothetical protein